MSKSSNHPSNLFTRTGARLQDLRDPLRRSFTHLATGGDWANGQSPVTRSNLVWFWFDGFFSSASDNIVLTYLTIYLLALGATQGQIGMMSSISSLMAAALLLPGAFLVERIGRRRNIVLFGGGWARIALLLLALAPLVVQAPSLIYLAMALAISRDALANLSFPAWMALTADVVPMEGRGRYFASRNFIIGITGMTTTFLIGLLITNTSQPAGYQVSLGISFAIGLMALFSFAHINDQPQAATQPRHAPAPSPSAEETTLPEGEHPLAARKTGLVESLRELAAHGEFARSRPSARCGTSHSTSPAHSSPFTWYRTWALTRLWLA